MHFSSLEAASGQEGLQAVRALIARLAPDLNEDSATYRAAFVMVAGQVVGRAVHRLAVVTGYPSEFVARCARRLVDNGVWPDGLACFEDGSTEDVESFWLDVGVAEGKFCRRRDETGSLQWAPAGHWWKEFDFALGRTVTEGVVQYKPATVTPTTLLRDGMCEPEDPEAEATMPEPPALVASKPTPRSGATAARQPLTGVGLGVANVVVLGGTELPSTRWLR